MGINRKKSNIAIAILKKKQCNRIIKFSLFSGNNNRFVKHILKIFIIQSRELLAFKYVSIFFFETNQMNIYICTSEILKTRF